VLFHCVPFYSFLDVVNSKAIHNFKSGTPILDAMILFMKEFRILASADSAESLHQKLKKEQLEKYGETLAPENIYEAVRQNPRFLHMKRGHQQDAEEFLGMLLEALHEESVAAFKSLPPSTATSEVSSPVLASAQLADGGWHEVGPKQRAAVTRSTGESNADSPITKIFGGQLRSELRVSGSKTSITLEPYRPLQLDIGAFDVNNIVDALKGLTKSETLTGDFGTKGHNTSATKQVFIDSLPPVLILHLKRFQYDNTGGVQKIWKKVGYPLELTIPKEAFPPQKRAGVALAGLPKYKLTAVVYHHGKNAVSGHYTVDVRREDDIEWIRLDDTVLRRLSPQDVAEAGAEEDPEVIAKAIEKHKRDPSLAGGQNPFESIDTDGEEQENDVGWKQVNGSGSKEPNRKYAAVANGTSTPTQKNATRESYKDNKVAYILFYRKIE
jgi:ubiquitin carboxyl-terminal hydrolase 10